MGTFHCRQGVNPTFQTSGLADLKGNGNSRLLGATGHRKKAIPKANPLKTARNQLTNYLRDIGINVRYLHSEIDAIERVEILRALRRGDCDVLVGINLLREGLDLPEVSLVAILDADKEGFFSIPTD